MEDDGSSYAKERIERHTQMRRAKGIFDTIIPLHEDLSLTWSLRDVPPGSTILVECLSSYLGRFFYRNGLTCSKQTATRIQAKVRMHMSDFYHWAANHKHNVIVVTNEVGCGIMSGRETDNLFIDVLGRTNQFCGRESSDIQMVVCGHPMKVK